MSVLSSCPPVFLSVTTPQPKNPLHGLTLETILERLVERYGWSALANIVDINCFKNDPSIKSSLKFLRKTPWARTKVENFYVTVFSKPVE